MHPIIPNKEYLSQNLASHLQNVGTHHPLTVSYTPHQNEVAERMNHTLVELVRTNLSHENVSNQFWAESIRTAAYIRKRVTSRSISSGKTPHELWQSRPPNLKHVRFFLG